MNALVNLHPAAEPDAPSLEPLRPGYARYPADDPEKELQALRAVREVLDKARSDVTALVAGLSDGTRYAVQYLVNAMSDCVADEIAPREEDLNGEAEQNEAERERLRGRLDPRDRDPEAIDF